jgi:amino acid transporter
MIGAGVFTTSGFSVGSFPSPIYVWLAWLVAGIIAICGAISYAALAKHFRESGGEYLYLTRSIHPAIGFVAGWISLTCGFTAAIAFAAGGFAKYATPLFIDQPSETLQIAVAVAIILLAASAHVIGLKVGLVAQNILVACKLALIALLIVVGCLAPNQAYEPVPFDIGAFATCVMWISLSYCGYNAVVYAASEIKDADRTIPRSTMLGTLLVMAIYLLLNYIFLFKTPLGSIAGQADVAAISANSIGGDWLELLTRIVISLATATSVFAMVMLGPRVYALMANDGYLPKFLSEATSAGAIWFQAILAIVLSIFVGLQQLLDYLSITLAISSLISVCALFVLKRRSEAIAVPLWPWPPIIFVLATFALIVVSGFVLPNRIIPSIGSIALGLVAYFVAKRAIRNGESLSP